MTLINMISGRLLAITGYFVLNLAVTFSNKQVLASARTFRSSPYLLTASHAFISFIGCHLVRLFSISPLQDVPAVSKRQHAILALFSLLYAINIALSQLSLSLVSLLLHQTIRASAPILTVGLSLVFLRQAASSYSYTTYTSLLLVTSGVILAITADASSSQKEPAEDRSQSLSNLTAGITLTFLGAVSAVTKTVLTHHLTTSLSLNLSAMQLLQILSPYAVFQALVFAYVTDGSLPWSSLTLVSYTVSNRPHDDRQDVSELPMTWVSSTGATYLLLNGILAFMLNVSSFEANRLCGPVSMAVAANLKQIVLLGSPVFVGFFSPGREESREVLTYGMVVGTFLAAAGGVLYAWSLQKRR